MIGLRRERGEMGGGDELGGEWAARGGDITKNEAHISTQKLGTLSHCNSVKSSM